MSDSERKSPDASKSLSAVESISNKLLEVTILAEKLDARLREAGERIIQDDRSSTRVDSPRQTTCENLKNEEKKECAVEVISDQNWPGNVIEDSNVEEYITATECSTSPLICSRSESVLTFSESEDALLRNIDQATTPTDYVLPVLSSQKSEPVIKPIAMKFATTGIQEEDDCDRAVSIQRIIEEKSGNVVKEVTETTTLRVSHDTRLGVSSYKLVANIIQDNQLHCDIKKMQDLKLTLESEILPSIEAKNSGATNNDFYYENYNSDFLKRRSGHLNAFDSKFWPSEQEEHSFAQNGSNGFTSLIKFNKIKMTEAGPVNGISTNYQRCKEKARSVERGAIDRIEEDEFLSKARMVSGESKGLYAIGG